MDTVEEIQCCETSEGEKVVETEEKDGNNEYTGNDEGIPKEEKDENTKEDDDDVN